MFNAANVSIFPLSSSIIAEKLSDTPEKLFGFIKKTSLSGAAIATASSLSSSKTKLRKILKIH